MRGDLFEAFHVSGVIEFSTELELFQFLCGHFLSSHRLFCSSVLISVIIAVLLIHEVFTAALIWSKRIF